MLDTFFQFDARGFTCCKTSVFFSLYALCLILKPKLFRRGNEKVFGSSLAIIRVTFENGGQKYACIHADKSVINMSRVV